jgi:hypothetical protein
VISTDAIDPETGYSIEAEALKTAAEAATVTAIAQITPAAGATVLGDRQTDPAALGLRAAQRLADVAHRHALDYIAACRGQGITWHEIGELAALGEESFMTRKSLALTAFNYAAGRRGLEHMTDADAVLWKCAGCGLSVRDYGPEAGSPDEAEKGHAQDCAHLAEAIRKWDAAWQQDV